METMILLLPIIIFYFIKLFRCIEFEFLRRKKLNKKKTQKLLFIFCDGILGAGSKYEVESLDEISSLKYLWNSSFKNNIEIFACLL